MDAADVTGVLVTRGDVDVSDILCSWPFEQAVVYDNTVAKDRVCYGRFLGCNEARHEVCAVQDDDCLVPWEALLGAYDGTMLLNIPPDEAPLLGWGAILDRNHAWDALIRYLDDYPLDDLFLRCCDMIVTELNDWDRLDLGHTDLPWATAPDRMYRRPEHYTEREEVRARCRTLRS